MIGRALAVALGVLLALAPPAAGEPGGLTLWPFYSRHTDPTDGSVETRSLGPLLWHRAGPTDVGYGLRPLFAGRTARGEDRAEVAILSPLAAYQRQDRDREFNLLRLLTWREEGPADGGPAATEFTLFPFLFARSGGAEGGYGGLLPFYIFLRDRLGFDEAEAVLFPLYARTVSAGRESRHFLFPFFAAYGGAGRRGFKAWPLYGEEAALGRLARRFVLWPFYQAQRTGLDTGAPQEARLVLPFFAGIRTPSRQYTSILPPFFGYTADREARSEQWDILWPLGQVERGEGRDVVRAFPIYGHAIRRASDDRFVLWPLYAVSTDLQPDERRAHHRVLLILFQDETGTRADGSVIERRVDVWPLLTYRRDRDGQTRFHALSFIEPILRSDVGATDLYGPLVHLFAYRGAPGGGWVASILWDLLRVEGDRRAVAWEFVGPLVSYRSDGNGARVVSVAGGLLEVGTAGEARHLRVLYLPRIQWGSEGSRGANGRAAEGGARRVATPREETGSPAEILARTPGGG